MNATRATRADEASTKRAAVALFSTAGSARVFVASAVALVGARVVIGSPSIADLVVGIVSVVSIGPVEWFLHRRVLHASEDAWSSRRLGTGAGHRRHHEDPPDLEWLMVPGRDAVVVVLLFGAVSAAWAAPTGAVIGSSVAGPFVTAWALATVALAHYEWAHLLFHTRYRCRTRYFRRLAANHRRHHYRNENAWLGVTTNTGDRLMNTLPARGSDVAMSATARDLAGR